MLTVKNTMFVTKLFASIVCGLMAGVFFAFSTFVMKGLSRLPAGEAIAAMQFINDAVAGSMFGVVFVITPLVCLLTMIAALWRWQNPASIYLLIGALLYLTGCLLVTLIFNIPLNNALATVLPNNPHNAGQWSDFLNSWMFWNHVRTVGSLAATVSFTMALCS